MEHISLFKLSGLPDPFGVVVLIFSFILLLSPYLSGSDFGVFKIPMFGDPVRKWLKIVGPAAFLVVVFCYLPVFSAGQASLTQSANTNPELKPLLSQGRVLFFEGFTEKDIRANWKVLEDDQKN